MPEILSNGVILYTEQELRNKARAHRKAQRESARIIDAKGPLEVVRSEGPTARQLAAKQRRKERKARKLAKRIKRRSVR